MKTELTWNKIKELIQIDGINLDYNSGTKTATFTSNNSEQISDLNLWLLDYFPHYLDNISYDVNNMYIDKYNSDNGCYWLELICIRREIA